MTDNGWEDVLEELFEKVLEALQPAGWRSPQDGGWGSLRPSGVAVGVENMWRAVHDAVVTWLVLIRQTTDEAVGMLVRRFPMVVCGGQGRNGQGAPQHRRRP